MSIGKIICSFKNKGFFKTIRIIYLKLIPLQARWKIHNYLIFKWLYRIYYLEFFQKVSLKRTEENLSTSHTWNNTIYLEWFLIINSNSDAWTKSLQSIYKQRYPHWNLKIIFKGSIPKIPAWIQQDQRISIIQNQDGKSITSINQSLQNCNAKWIGFSSDHDILEPSLFYEINIAINQKRPFDAIYFNHQLQSTSGQLIPVLPKTKFSYWTLLAHQYIGSVFAIHYDVFQKLEFFNPDCKSAFYDLILRLNQQTTADKVLLIDQLLWTRLLSGEKTSKFWGEYPYGVQALQEYWQIQNQHTSIQHVEQKSVFQHNIFEIQEPCLVSIIIPFRDHWDLTKQALDSILQKSSYTQFEILLIDNQSTEQTKKQLIEYTHQSTKKLRILPYEKEFNFSEINNFAIEHAQGDYVILFNNDVVVLSENWIESMLGYAQQEQVGAVGVKLYYPDRSIQHIGIALGLFECAGHPLRFLKQQDDDYFAPMLHAIREVSAVTAACCMVKKSIYQEVQGFDTEFAVAFNDVDFCLKLQQAGYSNLFLPHVEMLHNESSSRGADDTSEKQKRVHAEILRLQKKWTTKIEHDPFYPSQLTKDAEDCLIIFS